MTKNKSIASIKKDKMKKILINAGDIRLLAKLYNTPTAKAIFDSLPLIAKVQTWGEEIYFNIGLQISLESDAIAEVEAGELGYWPLGTAFCIFFGPTPVSIGSKPKAYSPVNVFGKITQNHSILKSIRDGSLVKVDKA